MKKVLGLDLGTTSIGWAMVNEAENASENSSIIRLGVRVIPLTTDEQSNFEKGKTITTNANRTLKRGMRRNLQRYKLRRNCLLQILEQQGWITEGTRRSEQGSGSTFQTWRLRARAASEQISLEQLARVLLMINKKRGYKSNRKARSADEGQAVDSMQVARQLYDQDLTPGQYGHQILEQGKTWVPDFYRSDLQQELDRIWAFQGQFHPAILTPEFHKQIMHQGEKKTSACFAGKYKIYSLDIKERGVERLRQVYALRSKALSEALSPEELALVVSKVNGQANNSSGLLGSISDRSKELYFHHQTIGQALMAKLDADPHTSLRNQPFYRQDYLDEFEQIWETQAQFHPELTEPLKREIRDVVIFYQRRLRSQKHLVSACELEPSRKVCPKSSPIFQAFRMLQVVNNLEVKHPGGNRPLTANERQKLLSELECHATLKDTDVLKLLFDKDRGQGFTFRNANLNYSKVEGNRTMAALLEACQKVIEMSGHGEHNFAKMGAEEILSTVRNVFGALGFATDWLSIDLSQAGPNLDSEPQYRLWHLLYSYEGDLSVTGAESLIRRLMQLLHMPREYAEVFAGIVFEDDYGNLSVKAMQKLLPHMQQGLKYSEACEEVGYRHSASSLTKEELQQRELLEKMEPVKKNSLRNPVVEKILNQMVNVVNAAIDEYGRPDEVRIELARNLKQNAEQREEDSKRISDSAKQNEQIVQVLQKEFGLQHVSRTDVVRYRLYQELEHNGFKALYSGRYIPREKLFSKDIDIEHIIPQARLFDDSFSNKTLEWREVNIEKGNRTALDYMADKYDAQGVADYKARVDELLKQGAISRTKANKLKMSQTDIPDDFIERDLRNTQYIARKAQEMLHTVVRTVTATSGSITSRLREDWQLVDLMRELNWSKYDRQDLTRLIEGRDGQRIYRIDSWTKRNDHRHHAMDALTIAFTKPSYIQYLNNLNARTNKDGSANKTDKASVIYAIEQKELYRQGGHLLFRAPIMPVELFRAEAGKQLQQVLVSIKAKNKVVTRHTNTTQSKAGAHKLVQLTPRGQLHKETVCASQRVLCTKTVAVGAKMDAAMIAQVQNPNYRRALQTRLDAFGGDPKKAFGGKNSLEKTPLYLDATRSRCVPAKVVVQWFETQYTVRKAVDKDLNLDKVVDQGIRRILQARLDAFGGNAKEAFANLDQNPIWLDRQHGICIKRVRCKLLNNAVPLHSAHDKEGKPILDKQGRPVPADFVDTGNNHHVAIFRDPQGNLQEHIVSFLEATERSMQHLPVIDKQYRQADGWQFLFSLKQNEYFVFPNPATGFNPLEVDLLDPNNSARISPNLYRVQKLSKGDYYFRHHLETTVDETKELKGLTWKNLKSPNRLKGIVKVRLNHLGKIVDVGEY